MPVVNLEKIAYRRPIRGAELILSSYRPLNIDTVYCLCMVLKCENEIFLWQGERKTIRQLTGHYTPQKDIREIRIRFYGGPLKRGAWHEGSIFSFLLDHIANRILTDGYQATKELLWI